MDMTESRRDFLTGRLFGLFGLGLSTLLGARTAASGAASGAASAAGPGRKPRAKACIVLFMWGGPAQQDTWDPKPDAPDIYRGEFQTIPTAIPGLRVCEHLPHLARRAGDLCLIRSMTHTDVNHTTATHHLLTGKPAPSGPLGDDWPNYGAVLARLRAPRGPLPPYVSMMPVVPDGAPRFVEQSHGQGAGWLGPVYNPLRIDADASSPDYKVGEFTPRPDAPPGRLHSRQRLLDALEPRDLAEAADRQALAAHYDRAFALLAAPEVARAFDLTRESPRVRERYGLNRHGQSVLQARRLVEAGVPLVTVFWPNDGITNVSVYWDTHNRNFLDLKTRLCPVTDQATSALLDDLKARGMLDETLVIWTGEMGRTPRVGQSVVGGAGAGRDGRDHWGKVFTTVLCGGGVAGGAVYGSSDRYAAEPSSQPTSPADLAATVYHLLGVDPRTELRDRLHRPLTLCDGQVIRGILA